MTYGVVGLVTVAITGLAVRIVGGNGDDGQKNQGDLKNILGIIKSDLNVVLYSMI